MTLNRTTLILTAVLLHCPHRPRPGGEAGGVAPGVKGVEPPVQAHRVEVVLGAPAGGGGGEEGGGVLQALLPLSPQPYPHKAG